MRKRSAVVRNSAYDLELRLNWLLFKTEQDTRIFSSGTDGWKPGDPIHVDPREMHAIWREEADWEIEDEPPFQFTRNMIEEHDLVYMTEDFFFEENMNLFMACVECEVFWLDRSEGGIKCWVCGGEASSAARVYFPPTITVIDPFLVSPTITVIDPCLEGEITCRASHASRISSDVPSRGPS